MNVIKIAGAGLSGLTCALTLARHGKTTVVYEKDRGPGAKYNGSILAFRNYNLPEDMCFELEDIGLGRVPLNPIYTVRKFSPSLRETTLEDNKPIYYTVKRGGQGSLDEEIAQKCMKAGVSFEFGKKFEEDHAHVLATGAKRMDTVCVSSTVKNSRDLEEAYVLYDNNYAPQGYLYVLPFKKDLTIGAVSFGKKHFGKMPELFVNALEKHPIISRLANGSHDHRSAVGFAQHDNPSSALNKGKYLVGEAAGFNEASKGFGMRYAIWSGHLAAKSIMGHGDYDTLWKTKFGKELEEGFHMRKKFSAMEDPHYEKLVGSFGARISAPDYLRGKIRALLS